MNSRNRKAPEVRAMEEQRKSSSQEHALVASDGRLDRAANKELHADLSDDVRGDAQYISAALSWYDGGPAGEDVKQAWARICVALSSHAARMPMPVLG